MEEKRTKSAASNNQERSEPVRSRWTPKPEQILILESIFNSGMVNPPKDETVRIRKLLEKFGTVGDANVFYWFQNRRSRSRRRQRQMQAGQGSGDKIRDANPNASLPQGHLPNVCGSVLQYMEGGMPANYMPNDSYGSSPPTSFMFGSSSACGVADNGFDNIYSMSPQMGFSEIDQQSGGSYYAPSGSSSLHLGNDGLVTIFINGVPTEVPSGSIDLRSLFGEDAILVYPSGLPVLTDEYGILVGGLQHGDSYYLVSKKT